MGNLVEKARTWPVQDFEKRHHVPNLTVYSDQRRNIAFKIYLALVLLSRDPSVTILFQFETTQLIRDRVCENVVWESVKNRRPP